MIVNRPNSRPRRTCRIRHIGVAELARDLGLSVPHVSLVLSGQRTSRRVTAAARAAGVITIDRLGVSK